MTFKALIADFGGVLTNPLGRVVRDFCEREGVGDHGLAVLSSNRDQQDSFAALERGDISQVQWECVMAEKLGVPAPRLLSRVLASLAPAEPMLKVVQDAREAGYVTACLTNSVGFDPFNPYAPWELEKRFDVVVASGIERVRKPDVEIYRRTLERLGVTGPDCVFVDDTERNLVPARELGMTTVLLNSADQAAEEIAALLV